MIDDWKLEELLRLDPLAAAEKVSGASYKEDESTVALGFFLMQGNRIANEKALTEHDDTTFVTSVDRYIRIAEDEGFKKILDEPIPAEVAAHAGDRHLVFWHPDGLLLHFDTYGGDVNGGKFYFNWRPTDPKSGWRLPMSHDGFRDGMVAGDMDCR